MNIQCAVQHGTVIGRHVLAVQTIRGNQVGVACHRITTRHAQVHVVVLAAAEPLVEPTCRDQAIAAVHHAPVHADEVSTEQVQVRLLARRLEPLANLLAVHVDVSMAAIDEPAVGRPGEAGEPGFDGSRFETIVRVEKHNV